MSAKDMSTEAKIARISQKNKKFILSMELGDLNAMLPWIKMHAANEEKDEELFNTQYIDMVALYEQRIALLKSQEKDYRYYVEELGATPEDLTEVVAEIEAQRLLVADQS